MATVFLARGLVRTQPPEALLDDFFVQDGGTNHAEGPGVSMGRVMVGTGAGTRER